MYFLELIAIGLSQLRANALRSILTILGIMIGVGAVIGVVSIGEGLRHNVVGQFSRVGGAKLIWVYPPRDHVLKGGRWVRRAWREYLTEEDLKAMLSDVKGSEAAFPQVSWTTQARHKKATTTGRVMGTLPGYDHAMDWELDRGRFISDWDVKAWSRVCVIGTTVAEELFGSKEPIGQEIKLKNDRYTVVGVMASRRIFNDDWGNHIVVPVTALQKRVTGNDRYQMIFVYTRQTADVSKVTEEIKGLLRRLHRHGSEFRVRTGEDALKQVDKVTTIMKLVAGGVAGISLLVGGIGIMNIMLVSVTERTREIGIRKALGAKRRHILSQFIIESVVLSSFGGFLGIMCGLGIGIGISAIIQKYSEADVFTSVVSFSAMGVAVLFSAAIGIFFGVYPAARAARLDPVVALHYE